MGAPVHSLLVSVRQALDLQLASGRKVVLSG